MNHQVPTAPAPGATSRVVGDLLARIFETEELVSGDEVPIQCAPSERNEREHLTQAVRWLEEEGIVERAGRDERVTVQALPDLPQVVAAYRIMARILTETVLPGSAVAEHDVASMLDVEVDVVGMALKLVAALRLVRPRAAGRWLIVIRDDAAKCVMANLAADVQRGELTAGAAVPSVHGLMTRFEISEQAARGALELLARTGMIRRTAHGNGFLVSGDRPSAAGLLAGIVAPARKGPTQDRVAGEILHEIVSGALQSPRVELRSFSERLGVSRATTEKAVRSLASEGRVRAVRGEWTIQPLPGSPSARLALYMKAQILRGAWPPRAPIPEDEVIALEADVHVDDVPDAVATVASEGLVRYRGASARPTVTVMYPTAAALADAVGAAIDSGAVPVGVHLSAGDLRKHFHIGERVANAAIGQLIREGYLSRQHRSVCVTRHAAVVTTSNVAGTASRL